MGHTAAAKAETLGSGDTMAVRAGQCGVRSPAVLFEGLWDHAGRSLSGAKGSLESPSQWVSPTRGPLGRSGPLHCHSEEGLSCWLQRPSGKTAPSPPSSNPLSYEGGPDIYQWLGPLLRNSGL